MWLPRWLIGKKNLPANAGYVGLIPVSKKIHGRREWQPTPVFSPGESQGWGSLVGCRLWGRTESDATEVTQQQQQYSMDMSLSKLQEIVKDRGTWHAAHSPWGRKEQDMTEQLSTEHSLTSIWCIFLLSQDTQRLSNPTVGHMPHGSQN